ncbi:MAG: peptidase M15 [Phycisphaerae bacterium]|nr:MAG: peptidase M15 [Phycisphaerae bacterium]
MTFAHPKRLTRAFNNVLTACLLIGFAGCSATRLAHDPVLCSQLDDILNRHADKGAMLTARVIDLESGTELFASNENTPVMPASNMKLVISSAGLDLLGADYKFETHLARDGNDVWIIGTGNPAVGDSPLAKRRGETTMTVFDDWVKALKQNGINRITGDLVYYEGAFDAYKFHDSWDHDDLVHWYAAPVSGLNFNDNCVDITISPTTDGQPVSYTVTPPFDDLVVINECITGKDEAPTINRMPHANVIVIGGGCDKKKTLKSKPVTDPGAFFAGAFRRHLASNGITIDGEVRSSPSPLGDSIKPTAGKLIATHTTTMPEVLWRINKSSQNLFAECMCKLSGRVLAQQQGLDHPGSWAGGEKAIRAFLKKNDIDDSKLKVSDGSGLSRGNNVTARLISDILIAMHKHKDVEVFRASLAEPGETGTLGRRMKGLNGRLFAKTGYIRGVRALSGYIHTANDRWLVFSFIYNRIPGSVQPFNKLQNEACELLYNWDPAKEKTETTESDEV